MTLPHDRSTDPWRAIRNHRSSAHLVDALSRLKVTLSEQIERIYTDERDRILATLIGLLHDFDLAEEAMQEAFAVALTQWADGRIPANPRAWIVSAARHKALDRLRRDATFREKFPELQRAVEHASPAGPETDDNIPDDRLRLIFTNVAIRRWRLRVRWRSRFERSADSPQTKLRAPFWFRRRPWRRGWSA